MSLAAGMLHVRPHPEVILPIKISSHSRKLSRKRKIDWDALASTSFDDDEVVVIVASGTSASWSSSSTTLPPDTSSASSSVSGTSTTSATSSADHATSDTQPSEMGTESSEGDDWLVVHSDICECNRCIAEHGEIDVRLF